MSDQPAPVLLSIVIPVYNELHTWRELLRRVQAVTLPGVAMQIILVDDCSTDGTREELQALARDLPIAPGQPACKFLFHEHNQGKGAALRTGFAAADGDVLLIQDADLEYDPRDYPAILEPILAGHADVVYGSRFAHGRPAGAALKIYLANRLLTALSNWANGLRLSDMETCYKAFRRQALAGVTIEQNRFGFEPEITAKVAARGLRLAEVAIGYAGRTRAQGKKIGFKDGLRALWCIWKYRPRDRSMRKHSPH